MGIWGYQKKLGLLQKYSEYWQQTPSYNPHKKALSTSYLVLIASRTWADFLPTKVLLSMV